jgi:two-component system CheB/CheR fusion protein
LRHGRDGRIYDAAMVNPKQTKLDGAALLQGWLRQSKDQGVIVLDRHGLILEWLAGAQEILGFSAQEAVGHHIAMIFTDEDRTRGYPDHELTVAARDRFSEDSRWHVRRDGTRIWVTGSVSAVREHEGGEVQGFVKVIRDMTDERTRAERLEHEAAVLAEARQENRQFLRTLGHDIRNPLSVLVNAAMVLERVMTDERGLKALRLLEVQLEVLKRLADDLRNVARPEAKVQLDLSRIDLCQLLHEVADAMGAVAAEKSVRIEAILPPAPLWVDADAARIRHVAVNLIGNAIKFNKQGGNVWIAASQEGGEAVCRITDDGLGIFPPVLPRLFELFSQANEGEGKGEGGMGVGLVLVRELVEPHGGTVQAKSAGLGKGAEFSFRLPLAADPQP